MPGSASESDEDSDDNDDIMTSVPREMISDAQHFTTLDLDGADTLDRFLSCPVCLGLMTAPTATECLHRFCSECIETSLRIGKKECPSCRFPIATRRSLRRDYNFESLMRTLYPDGNEEEIVDVATTLRLYAHKPLRTLSPTSPAIGEASREGGGSSARKDASKFGSLGRMPKQSPLEAVENESGRGGSKPGGAQGAPGADEPGPPATVKWACPQCTLINSAAAKKCKVCDAPNPTRPAPLPKPRKERPSQMSIEGEADGESCAPLRILEFRHHKGIAPIPLDEALAPHPTPASNALSRAARQAADFLHVMSGP